MSRGSSVVRRLLVVLMTAAAGLTFKTPWGDITHAPSPTAWIGVQSACAQAEDCFPMPYYICSKWLEDIEHAVCVNGCEDSGE
jgi:hypothetical protein